MTGKWSEAGLSWWFFFRVEMRIALFYERVSQSDNLQDKRKSEFHPHITAKSLFSLINSSSSSHSHAERK